MAEYKAVLQKFGKKVSAIFNRETVQKNNSARQQNAAPAAVSLNKTLPSVTAVRCVTAPVPQRQQPEQLPPKTETAGKATRFFAVVKIFKQIPWRKVWKRIHNNLLAPKQGVNVARQRLMVILVPVLFVVFVFVFMRAFAKPAHKISKNEDAEKTKAVGGSNNEINWQIPEPYPPKMRDPMQLGSTSVAGGEADKLIVKGIVYSEDASSAIIGNQIVHAGEEVLGVTVVKINKDSVEFESNGKKWTQRVQK